jgi:lipopolysaccharide/colanic/teichoic acid biosynthesis glycosyltransferase
MNRRFFLNLLSELLILVCTVSLVSLIKYGNHFEQFVRFYIPISGYFIILVGVSFFFSKYEFKEKFGFYRAIDKYFKAWFITTVLFIALVYLLDLRELNMKWVIVGFSSFLAFEMILLSLRYSYRYAVDVGEKREKIHQQFIHEGILAEELEEAEAQTLTADSLDEINEQAIRELILKYSGNETRRVLLFTFSRFNMQPFRNKSLDQIINLSKINRIRFINKFHETAYIKLRMGGLYFICTEVLEQRKKRILRGIPPVISHIYWILDFFIHRVGPRLPYIRKIYFFFWQHWRKPISYAESLGRLYSCGFELVEEKEIDNKWWFVMRKGELLEKNKDVTYGPLIRLSRFGKGGRPIRVYKFRTMHPYSEYLQGYVMQRNCLDEGGKFKNDFRISRWGRFLRRMWLDELPMLANLIRCDVKLVGVRPLSKQYLSLYPEDFQKKRAAIKPGLVPPFYADIPKTLEEIIASENSYIDAWQKNHFSTDWRYFWKAVYNIVIKGVRSK